ncbi:MAG TPA: YebC/PmpR family DNA-binding transcriptional regulator [Spirochaetota bacterium]|mgnify:FL=1|nr:YebC/PmpR family DNA-binding transcriptional regulator [Spirochaetota bacterium]HPC39494.1 YebC/PmpR family DNA-binding transcriptional regulator [Spirochaetota bacterium]HPL16290.1 YebC/PmpR family DNA-binding transcriptional regulator [Spirochaetota bacterium]HQF06831.1 YebC/PmpR family DNA-binding transcriptional regulator [Spirochaetota bacterium]HQH95550.1 YebC/PmpR family DNA-binding transcriptional regulator [Spirochaetota bacterium]
MSGHSKWATIKRKKGSLDAKRGALFTKIIREITVAAKNGGDDITANPRLRTAVAKAKANNMPSDNIERAIKKGTGTLEGVTYEEIQYEGYGPGGVAIMVSCLTDNRNRTTAEVRAAFTKHGGNLGETGSVGYLFNRKGYILIEAGQTDEDTVMELLMDCNVEDIKTEDGNIEVVTPPDGYNEVHDVLINKGFKLIEDEITFIPQTSITLDEKKGSQCLRLIETLEDLDDVQNVYSNYDIPDDVMMKISEAQ